MRKAFIGLSTPIGFDYQNHATQAKADTYSSPNPVLDSPFGLLLLFDELVFLSRSLCPENMRALPYVSFLDEGNIFPKVTEEEVNEVWKTAWNAPDKPIEQGLSFQESLENAGAINGMGIDNHSHGLSIGPFQRQANADPYNLAIDAYICKRLNDPSIELVTNSRLEPFLEPDSNTASQSLLTQLLVLENIPNYLTPQGPYHPVIEEVRANRYLAEFRKWVTQQQGMASPNEVKEVKAEVENALQDAQEKLFLKHCDQSRHYRSVGKAMLGDAIGILFPATGTVTALIEAGADAVNPQAMRWQGFLVGARRNTRASLVSKA
jgi:hypothetical protein